MYEYEDIEIVANKLKTNCQTGLTNEEAKRRLLHNGGNVLEGKKKDSTFKIFLKQLQDPMIYILLAAIALSFILKEYSDAIVILVVVILNALIGMFQEIKTEKSLEMLKKLSGHKAHVIRNGQTMLIDTREIVKGDLVCLASGNSVGADMRIVEANNLSIDESSLTGEFAPVKKDSKVIAKDVKNLGDKYNMAFMSTLVSSGRGKGIVVNVGMSTEIGKIAKILKEDNNDLTPLQKRLFDLGKLLGVLTIGVCLLMFIIAILEKRNILDMLISSISLAVAAIPEGLPAVVTIVLAIGVQRMIKVNTLVKRLPSVETLGSVNVICSDKTGTLTENKLKAVGVYENGNYKENCDLNDRRLIENAGLCNNANIDHEVTGSPLEIALLELLKSKGKDVPKCKRIAEKEFDSARKMMSTVNLVEGRKILYCKGAFDKVIENCSYYMDGNRCLPLSQSKKNELFRIVDEESSKARRIIAFAYKEDPFNFKEEKMIFSGFISFLDTPRKGVREAIEKFKCAGIKTIMITGDYIKTGYSIARELGIAREEDECISGDEIDYLTDEELKKVVTKKSVFARVTPEHKARIVDSLKANDNIVAMTGDGVNDAPSLKKADIGISMGVNGSDVAKEASDMVLTDDNFTTIEVAIEEGRTIYNNIKKSVLFLLSSNFAEIIVMIFAIAFRLPLPLLAIHILVVNLLTDSIPALALGADLKEPGIMSEKPRSKKEGLFSGRGLVNTIVYGILIATLTIVAFLIPSLQEILDRGVDINLNVIRMMLSDKKLLLSSQTSAFIVLSLGELFYSLSARNINITIFRKDIFKNKYLNMSILSGIAAMTVFIYIPLFRNILRLADLNLFSYIILILVSASILLLHELFYPLVSRETEKDQKVKKRDTKVS